MACEGGPLKLPRRALAGFIDVIISMLIIINTSNNSTIVRLLLLLVLTISFLVVRRLARAHARTAACRNRLDRRARATTRPSREWARLPLVSTRERFIAELTLLISLKLVV